MSSLGYRVTASGVNEGRDSGGPQLSNSDKTALEQHGVELLIPSSADIPNLRCEKVRKLLESRPLFYSAIITSQATVFGECKDTLMTYCNNQSCSMILQDDGANTNWLQYLPSYKILIEHSKRHKSLKK